MEDCCEGSWQCSSKDLGECKTKATKEEKLSLDTASKNVDRLGVARESVALLTADDKDNLERRLSVTLSVRA